MSSQAGRNTTRNGSGCHRHEMHYMIPFSLPPTLPRALMTKNENRLSIEPTGHEQYFTSFNLATCVYFDNDRAVRRFDHVQVSTDHPSSPKTNCDSKYQTTSTSHRSRKVYIPTRLPSSPRPDKLTFCRFPFTSIHRYFRRVYLYVKGSAISTFGTEMILLSF